MAIELFPFQVSAHYGLKRIPICEVWAPSPEQALKHASAFVGLPEGGSLKATRLTQFDFNQRKLKLAQLRGRSHA